MTRSNEVARSDAGTNRRAAIRWIAALMAVLVASPAAAWDPIKQLTGSRLDEHIARIPKDIENIPRSWGNCARAPGHCVRETIEELPARSARPVLNRYKAHLFDQARSRWQRLPESFVQAAQRFYAVDLRRVRFATGIDTVHGQAITWGNEIFFPQHRLDLSGSRSDVELMLHELEHVVQYNRRGVDRFLSEYALKAVGKLIQRGSFNVHDHIDIERAADRKASRAFASVWDGLDRYGAARPPAWTARRTTPRRAGAVPMRVRPVSARPRICGFRNVRDVRGFWRRVPVYCR